jgi:elongator complex protein 3
METIEFCKLVANEIIELKISTKKEVMQLRDKLAKKYNPVKFPSLIEILINAPNEKISELKKFMLTKPVRSMSGVAPVALMTKPIPCPHGKCIYCPGGPNSKFGNVPQSYTGGEPATMRGIRNHFDPYLQIFNRLEQYALLGHDFDKIELIFMGGTFPAFDLDYQEEFTKYSFKALNDFSKLFFNKEGELNYLKFKEFYELPTINFEDKDRTKRIQKKLLAIKGECNLEEEQIKNETAKIKCVALCIETKPDWGFAKHGHQMLKLGCTRIELGIQSVYEDVIKKVNRGHTVEDTKKSIRQLKDLGFKVAGHYMPGLPLTDKERDIRGMKKLFSSKDFRPDMLKIYPTMVSEGTPLYNEYKLGKFEPLNAEKAAEIIIEFKKEVPNYCRIMRIQRDIPTKQWTAGVEMTNFRQYITNKENFECNCIRCREPKGRKINWDKVKLLINEYKASEGKEFFISAEDIENNIIIGFVRMRFPSEPIRREITHKSALIRELHVYGTATAIGKEGNVQHRGWGKKLMKKAEEIAKENNKEKMVVISGVGVREYYYKLGYKKEGPYVVKQLNKSIILGKDLIELINFENIDPIQLSVLKKLIGKFTEDMINKNNNFKKIILTLSNKNKYELKIKVITDKEHNTEISGENIFIITNKALKNILKEI